MLDLKTVEQAEALLSAYNTNRVAQARLVAEAQDWELHMEKLMPGGVVWRKVQEKARISREGAAVCYERAVMHRKALYELTGITVRF